jgi:outer membrane lipoprotein-sorting protein
MGWRLLCRLLALAMLGLAMPQAARAQVHAAVLTDRQQIELGQIAQYLNAIRSLKARFLQIGPDGKTTQGTVWLQRPGRMRFQYDPPSPLLLVAGHGTVIFHDAQLDQTTNIPIGQTPLGLLLGDTIAISGDVTVTDFEQSPGQVDITLVRTATPGEGSLTLQLNTQPLALVGWNVVDAQGQETQLRMSDIRPGGDFDQALFTFTDPDDGK